MQTLEKDETFQSACVDHLHSHTLSNGVNFKRLYIQQYAYTSVHVQKNEVYFGLKKTRKCIIYFFGLDQKNQEN